MKTTAIILLVLILLQFPVQSQVMPIPVQIDSILKSVKMEFCPDPRLDYFKMQDSLAGQTLILKGETSNRLAHDSLIARLSRIESILLQNEIVCLPQATLGDSIYGIVRRSVAYQRRHPDVTSELVNEALMGETLHLLKTTHDELTWYLTQTQEGYLGWVWSSHFTRLNKQELDAWHAKPRLIVTATFAIAYSGPDENSETVTDLVIGNVVEKIGSKKNWLRIGLPDGRTGFVKKDNLMDLDKFQASRKSTPQTIIKTAQRFVGFCYTWGGVSSKGFDCSGFTKTIFRLNGIELPRDANMQVKVGTPVEIDPDLKNLRAGDLIFFGRSAANPTHVGVYAGNLEFYHSDGIVKHESFDPDSASYNKFRKRGLVAARRVLP